MAALPRPVELPVLLRVEFAQLNNNTRNQNRGADDDMDGDAENEELAVSPLPPLPSTLSLATCVAFDANNFCVAFDANNLCVAFDANNFHIRSLHAPREGASRVKVRVRVRVTHQGKVQAGLRLGLGLGLRTKGRCKQIPFNILSTNAVFYNHCGVFVDIYPLLLLPTLDLPLHFLKGCTCSDWGT